MGNIIGRFLLPHPSAAIPAIGGAEAKTIIKTLDGFAAAGNRIAALKPQTIIVITPHGPCFNDHYYMPDTPRVSGDLSAFGAKKILLGFDNNVALASAIGKSAKEQRLSAGPVDKKTMKQYGLSYDLDHGVIVPLYFINHFYTDYQLLPISLASSSAKNHYRLGMIIEECVAKADGNAVIIASGNLSHKLRTGGAYGDDNRGFAFDRDIQNMLCAGDAYGFLNYDGKLKEQADQCGFNAYLTLLGSLDKYGFKTEICSYEGTLGVGCLTAEIHPAEGKASTLKAYLKDAEKRTAAKKEQESFPAHLGRLALSAYLETGKEIEIPADTEPSLCQRRGGVFVTLKKDGQLRGLNGTTRATQPTLAEEIIYNAIAAGTKDPRFEPVRSDEMDDLTFSVDIISAPEEVADESELDPKKYGVIVENRGKVGILLPDLDGIDSVAEQLKVARSQGGIHPWHTVTIKRFGVIRYE